MYDGTTFMGIENFTSCQFFEHDIAEDNKEYMVSIDRCKSEDYTPSTMGCIFCSVFHSIIFRILNLNNLIRTERKWEFPWNNQ